MEPLHSRRPIIIPEKTPAQLARQKLKGVIAVIFILLMLRLVMISAGVRLFYIPGIDPVLVKLNSRIMKALER